MLDIYHSVYADLVRLGKVLGGGEKVEMTILTVRYGHSLTGSIVVRLSSTFMVRSMCAADGCAAAVRAAQGRYARQRVWIDSIGTKLSRII